MAHVVVRVARNAGIVALFIVAAMLGILSGVLFAYAGDLPQISALDDYTPSTITRVYASGRPGHRRVRDAAARRSSATTTSTRCCGRRSSRPRTPSSTATSASTSGASSSPRLTDIIERRRAQGASTLTQQLARNLKEQFGLTNEKSFERKIREAILAIQIEKRYTKREIFTIYCNQMYLGHGAYGVEAASRLYFEQVEQAARRSKKRR